MSARSISHKNAPKHKMAYVPFVAKSLIRLPKMPRRILQVKVILFSALPIQMIGTAALPDLSRQF
jgi:hypothetical protein